MGTFGDYNSDVTMDYTFYFDEGGPNEATLAASCAGDS